jgi:hypothetical protein
MRLRRHLGSLAYSGRVIERRAWRRMERAAVSGYREDLAASLGSLTGLAVLDVTATQGGTVGVAVPGWNLGLADVGGLARVNLLALARRPCHVAGSGAYGPFWWVAVAGDPPALEPPVVLLGSRVRLRPDGGERQPPPERMLTPRGTRKEYSLP